MNSKLNDRLYLQNYGKIITETRKLLVFLILNSKYLNLHSALFPPKIVFMLICGLMTISEPQLRGRSRDKIYLLINQIKLVFWVCSCDEEYLIEGKF